MNPLLESLYKNLELDADEQFDLEQVDMQLAERRYATCELYTPYHIAAM